MIDVLRVFIKKHALIKENDKVLIALSGGMDSMVLFDLLVKLRDKMNFTLIAAHFNHHIRKASDNDAIFVQNACEKHGIAFSMGEADIPVIAKKEKLSIEVAARMKRRVFLQSVATDNNANKIALAHHKNDRAETYLMRIIRGSSLDGLGCMPEKDDNIIRPLLFAARDEIKIYAHENKLEWQEDETNKDISYTRNNIRHNTLAHIKENYNANIVQTLSNSAALMYKDRLYFEEVVKEKLLKAQITNDGYYLNDDDFIYLHDSILSRCIKKALENLGFRKDIYEVHIAQVMALFSQQKTGATLNLPNGAIARRDAFGVKLIRSEKAPLMFESTKFHADGQTNIVNCGTFVCHDSQINVKKVKYHSKNVAFFDTMGIPHGLVVRSRKKGDVFHQLGASGKKSLKEYFIDKKISRFKRDSIPLIASKNEILWIVGYEISDKVKITDDTIMCKKIIFNEERG
ncbi:MAG: tRNA lysidine(34) synthetase TilS [Clostridiales bacterium]|nr:tRNA lysidine(34) synthetase TilS [Clostridiales bacterium]